MTPLHGQDVETSYDAWVDALRAAGGLTAIEVETVGLEAASGRVTARAIVASRSSPPFDAAAMDGIAVAAAATAGAPVTLTADAYLAVDTGDPLPPKADAVVRREDVVVEAGATVEREVVPYTDVRQVGEDLAAGDLVFPAGHCLRPPDLAVMASVGETSVAVGRRPIVVILPSGDELVPLGTDPGAGQIVETNSLMLAAMVEETGGIAERRPIVPDDPEHLAAALEQAAADADLVLLVAGSAKGAGDHAVSVIGAVGQIVARGVAIRPGHPVVLGLAGSTPVIGVPGYPVSAALAFELLGARLLAELVGRPIARRRTTTAIAPLEIPSTPRSEEWIRVRLGRVASHLLALPLRRGAAVLSSLARADGLVRVPVGSGGVAAGDEVEVELLRPLAEIEAALLATGSTDPLLDQLVEQLRGERARSACCDLRADPDGSANGAAALVAARCHLALVVSDDIPAGAITIAAWERQVGLMLAPGNPLGIDGVDALRRPGVRLANRQPGSSSRALLDNRLAAHSIDPRGLAGYRREARSHTAAAAAVYADAADCAVGVLSACNAQYLDFVPLATQTLALVTTAALADDDRIATLRELVRSAECRDAIEACGYRALPVG